MALYQVAKDRLDPIAETTFAEQQLLERKDLQRWLKADISPIGDDLMVIAEEFGDWDESKRRIDLLCIDRIGKMVVVELKRTEDGGFMELQAVRYAAMVAGMTIEQLVRAHSRMLGGGDENEQRARTAIAGFLNTEISNIPEHFKEVRIVLVSANFSQELTNAVLWLNEKNLDIQCIRLTPYRFGNQVLVDVSQIIPLPEAELYTIKVREQAAEANRTQTARQLTLRRFWSQLIERAVPLKSRFARRSTTSDQWLSVGLGRTGFNLFITLQELSSRVECYISLGKGTDDRNLAAFNSLLAKRMQIEAIFGGELDWQPLEERSGCRVCTNFPSGWGSPESEWPRMQDELLKTAGRLEVALKDAIDQVQV